MDPILTGSSTNPKAEQKPHLSSAPFRSSVHGRGNPIAQEITKDEKRFNTIQHMAMDQYLWKYHF